MRKNQLRAIVPAILSLVVACSGSTGGTLVEFDAVVVGPKLSEGERYEFSTPLGYRVRLDRARLFIGAVYLNRSRPTSVNADTSCFLPGVYVGEVLGGREFDLLSGARMPFPERGVGTNEPASVGELWLASGAIDAPRDSTKIAVVEGEATRDGSVYPFEGKLTISANRLPPIEDPNQPGAKPICKQRVVTPIDAQIRLEDGGTLEVHVEPSAWFRNVDFEGLERVSESPPLYRIRDDSMNSPSLNFYTGVRASSGTYRFEFQQQTKEVRRE